MPNALPEEWGKFTPSIHGKKEVTPFNELWSCCKIKETRLKTEIDVGSSEQAQTFAAIARREGKFGKVLKKRRTCRRFNAMAVMNMGTTREIFQSSKVTTKGGREKADIIEEVEEAETKKSKEEVKDLYYD